MLDELFMGILDMTKTGSIVILFVLAARLLLRRAPKVFSYALWAVVLVRLLCPFSIGQTQMSLVPEITPVSQDYGLSEEPITILEAGNAALNAVGDALNGGLGVQHIHTTQMEPDGSFRVVTTEWYSVWILFGQYVWLAGAACMILHSLHSYRKLRKRIEIAIHLRNNLYLADHLESPFVVGLIHPKIYLPSNLSQREYDYIILHEQHHIRRFDHIVKLLAFLALCIHWFNPLVWLAFHLASKDMEMSCDEAVVRKLGSSIRADYSASLLTLATGRRIIAGTPLAFGEGDPSGRIRNLAKWKKPAVWVMVLAVILCGVLSVCLMTDPAAGDSAAGNTWYYGTVVDHAVSVANEDGQAERSYITLQLEGGEERVLWRGRNAHDPRDILGKYVVVRAAVEADTGLLVYTSVRETGLDAPDSMENVIHKAIVNQNESAHPEDGVPFTSFVQLARHSQGSNVTVYGLALYMRYSLREGALVQESGSHVPVALTFCRCGADQYILAEYWEPRDGSYYADDIRAKFPPLVWPDTQAHIEKQIANCQAKAAAHFGMDPGDVISSSASANDFEIRLYSAKPSYAAGEEIILWATLEYKGEADRVTIWHGDPYISFSLTDGREFHSGGLVQTILTSTTLKKGEVYRFEYAKSGGYDPNSDDAEFWKEFYQDSQLRLPAGTYTVSVNGLFYLSGDQQPHEKGPSCELEITVAD